MQIEKHCLTVNNRPIGLTILDAPINMQTLITVNIDFCVSGSLRMMILPCFPVLLFVHDFCGVVFEETSLGSTICFVSFFVSVIPSQNRHHTRSYSFCLMVQVNGLQKNRVCFFCYEIFGFFVS